MSAMSALRVKEPKPLANEIESNKGQELPNQTETQDWLLIYTTYYLHVVIIYAHSIDVSIYVTHVDVIQECITC